MSDSKEVPSDVTGASCPSRCSTLLPLDDEVKWILGRPNFWCANIAGALRRAGHEIETSSEDEQACVIHWMLSIYLEHGSKWRDVAHKFLVDA
jgi:hypothetical protein